LAAELLERRYALAATPTATVAGPVPSGLIGQDIQLTVSFDNTGTDIGYSPFVDIPKTHRGARRPRPRRRPPDLGTFCRGGHPGGKENPRALHEVRTST
jgi:hypothetical protein